MFIFLIRIWYIHVRYIQNWFDSRFKNRFKHRGFVEQGSNVFCKEFLGIAALIGWTTYVWSSDFEILTSEAEDDVVSKRDSRGESDLKSGWIIIVVQVSEAIWWVSGWCWIPETTKSGAVSEAISKLGW